MALPLELDGLADDRRQAQRLRGGEVHAGHDRGLSDLANIALSFASCRADG